MPECGTLSQYNRNCRCALCVEANTNAMRRHRNTEMGRIKQRLRSRRDSRVRQLCMGYVRDMHPEVYQKFIELAIEMENNNA
jgi:hypothetical protein